MVYKIAECAMFVALAAPFLVAIGSMVLTSVGAK